MKVKQSSDPLPSQSRSGSHSINREVAVRPRLDEVGGGGFKTYIAKKSVTSLRRGPPLPSKPEYKARLLRASPRRCADGLRIIEAQVTSPHTHTRGTHQSHPRGCRLPYIQQQKQQTCELQRATYTKHYSHDTRGSGGAAAAAAAARAGGRVRTGRSSDRLGGRCSVCHERAVCAVRARSGAGKRGGAGTRGGGGEQASGPRAARRTGDRQAGDGPESDRAQRSEETSRSSLGRAADLEGVRSATVGVGGRPSCGEEGGRQVRVVRVALHRAVERRPLASVKEGR